MKKRIKVIFLENTEWGKKHKIVEVAQGFFLNYLSKKRKVLLNNEKNLLWLKKEKNKEEKKNLVLEEKAKQIYEKINNLSLFFSLQKNEKGEPFGSISFKDIFQELKKSDFYCEKSQLLDFNSINKIGENIIQVRLSNKLIADLKVIVK